MPKKLTDLAAATALADADQFVIEQSGTSKRIAASVVFAQDFWLPFNYIGGLITSNDAGDLEHDIAIAPGIARSDDDVTNLKLAAILTKQIDGLWVVGDDQPGLDAGAVANSTLYAVWLIKRSDTGVVDAIFSTSFTAPTATRIPDYDSKRLIAAVKTEGFANMILYVQSGDYFRYMSELPLDVSDTSITSVTWEAGVLSVPPLCVAHIYGSCFDATPADAFKTLYIRTYGAGDIAERKHAWSTVEVPASTVGASAGIGDVLTDAQSRVEYAAAETADDVALEIHCVGFTMLTRRDP